MIEFALLRVFLKKDNFNKYSKFVKEESLSDEFRIVLRDLRAYWEESTVDTLSIEDFATWFHHVRHSDYKPIQHEKYQGFFNSLTTEEEPEVDAKIIKQYQKESLYYKLEGLCIERADIQLLEESIQDYRQSVGELEQSIHSPTDFESVFKSVKENIGLKWPLNCLNRCLGSIRKGHLGMVAAPVHAGKTGFLCQLAGFMAQQLPPDQCVLFFNNESLDDEVQMRIIQYVLNVPLHHILKDLSSAEERYTKLLEGDRDKVKVIDCNHLTIAEIRDIAIEYNAGLIIIDQLANLPGLDNKQGNEALRLKKLAREASTLAKQVCPVIVSHQTDSSTSGVTREGKVWSQHFIGMKQLDFSKVHVPGALNYLITIGLDHQFTNTRYIHVPKNRMPTVEGMCPEDRFIKAEVSVDWERVRYED